MRRQFLPLLCSGIFAASVPVTFAADNPIVPDGAQLEKLFTRSAPIKGGLTEGPAVGPDGAIYFSDIPLGQDKSQIVRFDPKTKQTSVFAEDSFKSNGLAFDRDGFLIACEGSDIGGQAVARWDIKTKKRTVIADRYQGKRFNAPNDLVLDVDGRIYFSDPRYLGDEPRELEHRAVYRINLDGSVVEVTHDVEKPNGLALSRDQKWLYVADHNNGSDKIVPGEKSTPGAMKILAFPLGANGLPNGPKQVLVDYGTEAGCDGMCIDKAGNIYLTARGLKRPGVQVLNPKGQEIAFIATGAANQDGSKEPVGLPSNVEFGVGDDRHTLYVTIDKSLYHIKLKSEGYHIPFVDEQAVKNWERIELDPEFRSEGVAIGDLNGDGRTDLVAGDYWYEQPANKAGKWEMHEFRPAGKFVAGVGYSNSFCNYVWDIDEDGAKDIIVVGFPGDPFHWYKNPGKGDGQWTKHEIWHSICNESPDFVDVTGDGKPEFLFGSQPEAQMGFTSIPAKGDVAKKWQFNAVSEKGDPGKNGTFKYYHGLGVGDLNKDGRQDVLIAHGWWQQPEKLGAGAWQFHPYSLSKDGGNPLAVSDIHADDVDLDGDMDLIACSAHQFGMWWFENVGGNEKPQFKPHTIDESHSQTHAVEFVDINGDGRKDLVTGKRFFAHNGGDPGAFEPVMMYWYDIKKEKGKQPEFVRHEIVAGRDTGVGTQFQAADFNGDGKIDIALSNKKGVNLLLQK